MRKKIAGLLLLGLLLSTVGGAWAQSPMWAVNWWVVAGGGAQPAGGEGYMLNSTAGQPVVAEARGGVYALRAGFWQPEAAYYYIYLAHILR